MVSRLQPTHKSGFKKGVSGNPKGRPKGTANKRNAKRAADIAASGLTPLEFMMEVLRNPSLYNVSQRMWAANASAPYVHRKMPIAIEGGDKPLTVIDATKLASMGTAELEKLAAVLEQLGVGMGGFGGDST